LNAVSGSRLWLYGLVLVFLLAVSGLAYYTLVYRPEQLKKPYKKAGLTDKQASEFISKYPMQNGNSTWVEFAKKWASDKYLAENSFKKLNSLNKTLKFLEFADKVNFTDSKALEFLIRYPNSNFNSTWVEYAKAWAKDELVDRIFKKFESLNKTLTYLEILNENNITVEKGLEFLNKVFNKLGLKDTLEFFASDKSFDFLNNYPELIDEYKLTLPLYSKNSTLFSIIFDNFMRDGQIKDKYSSFLHSLENYLLFNLYNDDLTLATVHALNNLTVANDQLDLPLSKDLVWSLTNCTQVSDDIVDFNPVIIQINYTFKDLDGLKIYLGNYKYLDRVPENCTLNPDVYKMRELFSQDRNFSVVYVFKSNNIARDHWLIAENLRRDKRIIDRKDWYLALCMFAQQNGYDFFDDPEIKKYDLKPTSSVFWSIVDKFRAQLFNDDREGYPINFTWVEDKNEKKVAYMVLFELPKRIADLDEWRINRKVVYHKGLDAIKYTVNNMKRLYDEVMSKYPDGLIPWSEVNPMPTDPRTHFYGWIKDRGAHGLYDAHEQFLGISVKELKNILRNDPKIITHLDEYIIGHCNGINTYLSKSFPYWDLVEFTFGLGNWDRQMEGLFYPIAFKASGIPYKLTHYSAHYINAPAGQASGYDGGISGLPTNIINQLKSGKYGKVLILPGNTIDILTISVEGVIKDLEYGHNNPTEPNLKYAESYLTIRGKRMYFFRGGEYY